MNNLLFLGGLITLLITHEKHMNEIRKAIVEILKAIVNEKGILKYYENVIFQTDADNFEEYISNFVYSIVDDYSDNVKNILLSNYIISQYEFNYDDTLSEIIWEDTKNYLLDYTHEIKNSFQYEMK